MALRYSLHGNDPTSGTDIRAAKRVSAACRVLPAVPGTQPILPALQGQPTPRVPLPPVCAEVPCELAQNLLPDEYAALDEIVVAESKESILAKLD